ncbi:MAG: DNA-binding protein [Burkholderiaceae bacterium]
MLSNTPRHTPLDQEARAALPTAEAAYHLNRAPQTLRIWASAENGPLRPLKVNGRLAWPVADIRKLVGVAK